MSRPPTVHGSAVLIGETGILIRGASASGKSTLALELMSADPERARLVADDRVIVSAVHGRLLADVPVAIAGLIEVRGIGLLRWPHVAPVIVRLVVDLEPADVCPRLPESGDAETAVAGIVLPRLPLPVGVAGGADRVRAAIKHLLAPSG